MARLMALWRGRVPLVVAGWLYGALGLGLLSLLLIALTALPANTALGRLSFAVSAILLAYAGVVAVAIWRSAGNYRGPAVWRLFARGSVLIVALQALAGLSLH